jgi:hypothetical protein
MQNIRSDSLRERGASYRTSEASAGQAETSAERDQWRELPDERGQRGTSGDQSGARPVARATGRARRQRFRATSADRSESVIWGGARGTSARGESQTSGDARYKRREGI